MGLAGFGYARSVSRTHDRDRAEPRGSVRRTLLSLAVIAAASACSLGSPSVTDSIRPRPSTAAPSAITTPAASAVGSPQPSAARPAYLDDRSTADQLLRSYYNAVNRGEYARAYSYWQDPSSLGPYARFAEGYARTDSVDVAIIGSSSDAGAGQLYWTLATRLAAHMSDGSTHYFAVCYRVHLSRPEIQSPPYHGIELIGAETRPAATAGEANRLLLELCPSTDDRPRAAP